MGADSFMTLAVGKNMEDAHKNACEDAIECYGHQEGYNGTLTTCDRPCSPEPVRFRRWGTLEEYINKQLGKMEKWDCKCIEVKGKMLKDYKEKHGLKRTRKKLYVFYGWAAC